MFRPDSGNLQALVKIQILELTFKMQFGIPVAYITCGISNWDCILKVNSRICILTRA